MPWLDDLMKMYEELESPKEFWRWAGLATISAVAKDNVYLERAGSDSLNVYPNIYVMLHADSGLKKGPPVNVAKKLVRLVNNTKIISGRSSIQGILKELGHAQSEPGGKIQMKSVCFIAASEFSSSLVNDPFALTILTELYDRQYNEGEYKSLLKMETFQLRDPTITMLVATNEAHFTDFVGGKDQKGGFMGRTFVIAETEVNRYNSLMVDLKNPPVVEKLVPYLKEIAKLKGPFKKLSVENPAGKLYDEWYMSFYSGVKEAKIKDPTGTIQRFGDSVLKVAMLLSLSDSPSLEISESNIKEAISICERLIGNIRRTTLGKDKPEVSHSNRFVAMIQELMNRDNHTVTHQQLMKKYWMIGNETEWMETVKTMISAKVIEVSSSGEHVMYIMPDNQVAEYSRFFQGKNK